MANIPNPFQGDLDSFNKVESNWDDNSGQKLYLWVKDKDDSPEVPIYIGSDRNVTSKSRKKTLIFRAIVPYRVSNKISEASLTLSQESL